LSISTADYHDHAQVLGPAYILCSSHSARLRTHDEALRTEAPEEAPAPPDVIDNLACIQRCTRSSGGPGPGAAQLHAVVWCRRMHFARLVLSQVHPLRHGGRFLRVKHVRWGECRSCSTKQLCVKLAAPHHGTTVSDSREPLRTCTHFQTLRFVSHRTRRRKAAALLSRSQDCLAPLLLAVHLVWSRCCWAT